MSDNEQLLFGPEVRAQLAQMQAELDAAQAAAAPAAPGLLDTIVEVLAPPHEPTLGEIVANEVRLAAGPDTDGDGRSDVREREEGTNPARDERDLDMDGLDNTSEAAAGTSPHLYDSDHDGTADGLEAASRRDPMFPDGDEQSTPGFYERLLSNSFDADRDGLLDGVEAELGTSPTSDNTDGDRIPDVIEVGSWSPEFRLDPLSPDTDGDGRVDGFDLDNTRDEADDDFDGLDNTLEAEIGSSPVRYDSDGDGATDSLELQRDTDPVVFDELGEDDWEAAESIAQVQRFDRDVDGLVDPVEARLRTNPDDPDTDDDALPDGIDDQPLVVLPGMEPDVVPEVPDFAPLDEAPQPESFDDDLDAIDEAMDAAGDIFDGM